MEAHHPTNPASSFKGAGKFRILVPANTALPTLEYSTTYKRRTRSGTIFSTSDLWIEERNITLWDKGNAQITLDTGHDYPPSVIAKMIHDLKLKLAETPTTPANDVDQNAQVFDADDADMTGFPF